MEKKTVKRDDFKAIIEALVNDGLNELADVMRHELELLENKAAKAKANAAKKRAEGDALTAAIEAILTDEPATIADITASVECEGAEISTARVQYRLNSLVRNGKATKTQVTVGEGTSKRKLVAYSVAVAEAE